LSGKIQRYGITRAQLETEAIERGTLIRTDFEELAKLGEFLISLMLIAPTSAGAFGLAFNIFLRWRENYPFSKRRSLA